MKTRKERYKENREIRKKLGIIRKRCSGCGCYIEGRHKVWCKKMICKCGHGRNYHNVLGCEISGCPCESFEFEPEELEKC